MSRSGMLGLLVAIALLAGACGAGVEALTKDEYLQRANSICAEDAAEFDSTVLEVIANFGPIASGQDSFELSDEITDAVTPLLKAQLAELRELPAPERDGETLASLLDDLEAAIDQANELTDAAVAGDQAAIERLSSELDPFTEVNQRAIDYGLTGCGFG